MRARSALAWVIVTAGCAAQPGEPGGSPSTVVASPPRPPVAISVQVIGLPASLAPRASASLKAAVLMSTGETRDCTSPATWSVDDPRVAKVSAAGALTAELTGYFSVTASCDSVTGAAASKVEAGGFHATLVAFDTEVVTHAGIDVTMEFLEGARAGERVSRGELFAGIGGLVFPVRVRLTTGFHKTADFVLAEVTGGRRNSGSSVFHFKVPMVFQPDPFTETYVEQIHNQGGAARYPFRVAAAGTLEVRTWWAKDYNDLLFVELWCGDRLVRRITQRESSRGEGIVADVAGGSACEVRLSEESRAVWTQYRLAIRHPH